MIIEPAGSTTFTTQFADYEVVGFHAASAFASRNIERVGLLPHKILDDATHNRLLKAAEEMGFPVHVMGGYAEWLGMKSVTFTKAPDAAIEHAKSGKSGGQGLYHVSAILAKAAAVSEHEQLVAEVQEQLERIKSSTSIVYAVDLSGLGDRLVQAADCADYYRVHWPPSASLPSKSVVGPERLIARLDF